MAIDVNANVRVADEGSLTNPSGLTTPPAFLFSQDAICTLARQNKAAKKKSTRERYKVAQTLLDRLKRIKEDVSLSADIMLNVNIQRIHTCDCSRSIRCPTCSCGC